MTLRLQHQIFLSIFAVAMVMIVALGLFSARRAGVIVQDQTSVALRDALYQASINMSHVLNEARVVADSIDANPRVDEILSHVKDNEYDLAYLLDGFRYLVRILSLAESNPSIYRIRLFMYGDSLLGMNRRYLFNISDWSAEAFPPNANNTISQWRPTYDAHYPFVDGSTRVLSLRRVLRGSGDLREMLGVLSVDIRESLLADLLRSVSRFEKGYLAIFAPDAVVASAVLNGSDGGEFYHAGLLPQLNALSADKPFELVDVAGVSHVALVQSIDNPFAEWKLAALIPEQDISGRSQEIRGFTLSLVLAALVLSAVVAIVLARSITGELTELNRRICDVRHGTYERIPDTRGPTEIADLQHQYNEMADQIHTLIEQVYKNRIRRQEAEFKALEGQINPHFLYNTLDTIKWMAVREKKTKIADIADALSSFFRLSLNNGNVLIPVRDEVAHVQSYLRIQNARFGDRLSVEIHVDETAADRVMLKLVLQPIVENAIVHGIQKRADLRGTIRISAEPAGNPPTRLVFTVADNGIGMTPEQIANVMHHDSSGYAVKNIQQRIQLYYGSVYGLEYESHVGKGTVVTVHLPWDGESSLVVPLGNEPEASRL